MSPSWTWTHTRTTTSMSAFMALRPAHVCWRHFSSEVMFFSNVCSNANLHKEPGVRGRGLHQRRGLRRGRGLHQRRGRHRGRGLNQEAWPPPGAWAPPRAGHPPRGGASTGGGAFIKRRGLHHRGGVSGDGTFADGHQPAGWKPAADSLPETEGLQFGRLASRPGKSTGQR